MSVLFRDCVLSVPLDGTVRLSTECKNVIANRDNADWLLN